MIVIDNTIVSDDLRDVHFVCNPKKCKGACCVYGDAGAPLETEEISIIEDYLDDIKPFMTPQGLEVVLKNGVFDYDADGNFVTPLIGDKDCAFICFEDGIALCAIEKAFNEGKITFQKPVSCHLYPVRIQKCKDYDAVNYHRWDVCEIALVKGRRLGVPLYEFLKEPLIRYYGKPWYEKLKHRIEQ